jgi:mRNA interferase MazF
VICDPGEVVAVPFPFTDRAAAKRRPALVLSGRSFNQHGHTLMAMITTATAPWPLDTPFDWAAAGLSKQSIVRMKLFTIDNRVIQRRLGGLGAADWSAVQSNHRLMLL